MLRSLCGVIFFKFVTSFAYFFTRFSTARTPILRFCIDKNSAFSSPETGVISFRSSIYSHRAFLTSSPKYTTTSAPPFRWILIPLFFKSTSSRSRPTHSETRIPVPSISVRRAKSRTFVRSWNICCFFVKFSPDSTSSSRLATSSASNLIIFLSWIFGVLTLDAGFDCINSFLYRYL